MGALTELPNIGKVLERNLLQAGIDSPEKLRELGAREAFLRVRAVDSGACIRVLYGLQGAVDGIKDNYLDEETKRGLREFFRNL